MSILKIKDIELYKAISEGKLSVVKSIIDSLGRSGGKAKKAKTAANFSIDNLRNNPLHVAVRHGQIDVVKYLVQDKKLNVNLGNVRNATPLHIALMYGNFEMTKYLIENGADVNLVDANRDSAGHFAAVQGEPEIIRYLVNKNKAIVNKRNKYGESPLHSAAMFGNMNVLKLLIELGGDVKALDKDGHSVLYSAIKYCNWDLLKGWVNKNVPFDLIRCDKSGCKLLEANLMLSMFPWASGNDEQNQKVFSACQTNIVKYLIKEVKMNVNEKFGSTKATYLHFACSNANVDIVKVLVELGAFVDVVDNSGITPLHCAAMADKVEIVKYLIEEGKVDINKASKRGFTALHYAADVGYVNVIKLLLEKGADCYKIDEGGETPLDFAMAIGDAPTIRCLITSENLDVNKPNSKGAYPLHLACAFGDLEIIKMLLKKGANFKAVDFSRRTPIDYAAAHGRREVVKYFVQELKVPVNQKTTPRDDVDDINLEALRLLAGKKVDNCKVS